MELKLRQLQVQTAGTITGFNYAYCKILYDEAVKRLKTDIIDKNGDEFPINKNSEKLLKERLEKMNKANKERYTNYSVEEEIPEEEKQNFNNIYNKCCIHTKNNSILYTIFHHLNEQILEPSFDYHIVSYPDENSIRKCCGEIRRTLLYLEKVKQYLSMFE